jgi:hypothetical protein
MVVPAEKLIPILYPDGGTYPLDERLLLERLHSLLRKTGLLEQYEIEKGRGIHYFLAHQIYLVDQIYKINAG